LSYPPGIYKIKASVNTVPGEFLTANNSVNASTYLPLTFRGDTNRDGRVDIVDFSLVGSHFGAVKPSPNYLPLADMNNDGTIDVIDLSMVGSDIGKSMTLHDLAVLSLTLPTITPRIGELARITTVIVNIGNFNETSQVTLSMN